MWCLDVCARLNFNMAREKYVKLLCVLCCLQSVSCELNLSEGSPCTTEGYNGTCLNIFKCESAAKTYVLRNAGFKPDKATSVWFEELPDICSYKNNEIVVCCTDCDRTDEELYRNLAVKPSLILTRKGSVAWDKCLDYFQRLPFKCRGVGALHIWKQWSEKGQCHIVSSNGPLATGGRDAQRWEFPHVALLGYGVDVDSAQWLCGGSVISERYILTAAHCTSTTVLGNITYAALGLLKRSDPKKYWKVYKIKRIILHPEFKSPSKYHDIALLETETEINFGRDLLPACLDTGHEYYSDAEASGWGRLGHRKSLADNLQVIYLDEFHEKDCKKIYEPHRHLKRGYDHQIQMCFGDHEYIIDTCEGDSGGPLQLNDHKCQYTIIGVTSYGKDCGILGSAGMYTRVSYYVPWIESIVWPEETEAYKNLNKVK